MEDPALGAVFISFLSLSNEARERLPSEEPPPITISSGLKILVI